METQSWDTNWPEQTFQSPWAPFGRWSLVHGHGQSFSSTWNPWWRTNINFGRSSNRTWTWRFWSWNRSRSWTRALRWWILWWWAFSWAWLVCNTHLCYWLPTYTIASWLEWLWNHAFWSCWDSWSNTSPTPHSAPRWNTATGLSWCWSRGLDWTSSRWSCAWIHLQTGPHWCGVPFSDPRRTTWSCQKGC